MKIQETKTGRKYIKVKGKKLYLNTFLKRVNKKRLICHLLPISKITEKNAEKLILFLLDPTKKKLPKVKTKKDKAKLKEVKTLRSKIEKGIEQIKKIREVEQETKKEIKTEKDKDIIDKLKKSLKETQEAERAQAKVIKEVGQDLDKAIKDLNKDLPKEQKLPSYRETLEKDYPEMLEPFPTEAEIEEATRDQIIQEQEQDRKYMTEMLFQGLGKQNGGAWNTNGIDQEVQNIMNELRNNRDNPNQNTNNLIERLNTIYREEKLLERINFDTRFKVLQKYGKWVNGLINSLPKYKFARFFNMQTLNNYIIELNNSIQDENPNPAPPVPPVPIFGGEYKQKLIDLWNKHYKLQLGDLYGNIGYNPKTRRYEYKENKNIFLDNLNEIIEDNEKHIRAVQHEIKHDMSLIKKPREDYKEEIQFLKNENKINNRIKDLMKQGWDNDTKEFNNILNNIPSKGIKDTQKIIKEYISKDSFKSLYDELKKQNEDFEQQIRQERYKGLNLMPKKRREEEIEIMKSRKKEREEFLKTDVGQYDQLRRQLYEKKMKSENTPQEGGLIDKPEEALSNVEIEGIMKKYKNFLGVSPVDTGYKLLHMVKPKSNGGLIYNLDKAGERGSHWVAVYYDGRPGRKNNICYYDSFGRDIPKEIQGDIKQIVKLLDCDKHMKLKINRKVNQDKSSVSCGYLCALFLMDMMRGKSFKSATGFSVKKNEDRAEQLQEKFDYIIN